MRINFNKLLEEILNEAIDLPPNQVQMVQQAYSNPLVAMEKENEGAEHFVYKDTKGNPTIGLGFNLNDKLSEKCFLNAGISEEDFQAIKSGDKGLTDWGMFKVFQEYEKIFRKSIQKYIPNYDALPFQIQMVLFDLIYNLGEHRFSKFQKFIAAIGQNNFKKAAEELQNSKLPRTGRFQKNLNLLSQIGG